MKHKREQLVGGLCLIAILSSFEWCSLTACDEFASPPDNNASSDKKILAESLESDFLERLSQLEAEHQRLIRSLSHLIFQCQGLPTRRSLQTRGSNEGLRPYSSKEEALIVLAGKVKAESCVHFLLNRITEREVGRIQDGWVATVQPGHQGYPALEALIKIGDPAGYAALERLPQEQDAEARKKITELVCLCFGKDFTRTRLARLQTNQTDEAQRQRVAEAIQQLDDAEPSKP